MPVLLAEFHVISPWPALVILFAIASSSIVLLEVVRRQTRQRVRYRLLDWAKAYSMRCVAFDPKHARVPSPLDTLPVIQGGLKILTHFTNDHGLHLVRFNYADAVWHLLIMRRETDHPDVGLRPTEAPRSICDLFNLTPAPRQLPGVRFTVMGDDWIATRDLAQGMARGLLPGDLSLIRTQRHLLIDFTSRPYDELELTRMKTLALQMATVV